MRLIYLVFLLPTLALAGQKHVTTTGGTGAGTIGDPWSLSHSFTTASPGDTVWIHGGTYSGARTIWISGTAGNRIMFRNYQNERVVFSGSTTASDHAVVLGCDGGNYLTFWGIEFGVSGTDKSSTIAGSAPPSDINISGSIYLASGCDHLGVYVVNCIARNPTHGPGLGNNNGGGKMYGNIAVFTGWYSTADRAHGHSFYTQGDSGARIWIKNNISLFPFSHHYHNYGGAWLGDMTLDGNIAFGHDWNGWGEGRPVLWGGSVYEDPYPRDSMMNNVLWDSAYGGVSVIGYGSGLDGFVMRKNILRESHGDAVFDTWGTNVNARYEDNLWIGDTVNVATGAAYIGGNTLLASDPVTGDTTVLFPNDFDPDRAHLAVLNWDKGDSVTVNVSSVFSNGDTVRVYNTCNIFGDNAYAHIVSGGVIRVPMMASRWTVEAPVGGFPTPNEPYPLFGPFLLTGYTLSGTNVAAPVGGELPIASRLVFTIEPANTVLGLTITPAIRVSVVSPEGYLIIDDTRNVTVSIVSNPGGGTLSGTTTVAASGGIATFSNLSISAPGTSYTLKATATGLTADTSAVFNITQQTPKKHIPWKKRP